LWRIKEEPHLWRRYLIDGITLVRLLFTRILPLAVRERWSRLSAGTQHLIVDRREDPGTITLSLVGAATARNVGKAVAIFRDAVATKKKICINLADISVIDARFFGLLLMLRKRVKKHGSEVTFFGATSRLQTSFRLNEVGFLLAPDHAGRGG
jgi:N-acetylglucosaminyldiphosphoundecaprenol N-acetyl-beta-D-mannosaminyltransferase